MNTNFSRLGSDSNSNFYNPDWRNHSDFSWQAQVAGNCAPQYHELHHPEYPQFNHQSSPPSSYNYPAQELLLEDTIKACTQKMKQNIQELRSVQANFSNSRFDSNSSFYNSDWSNHSDFSWQDQATGNYASPRNELHYPEYPQFKNQVLNPSSYDPIPQRSSLEDALKEFIERTGKFTIQVPQPELSLEDTVKAFIQASSQNIQELKNVTMSNDQIMQELNQSKQELKNANMSNSQTIQELTDEIKDSTQFIHQAFAKMEKQIDYLVVELNRIEEEELQSQLMAYGHYMIDEDDASHSCHEHVPETIILESKEIVDNNEEEGKEEQVEHIDQVEHKEQVEHKKKIEPPANTSLSNDKEVSTKAHSFIIVPLETHHESKASILQCLKELSYAKILKDLCRQAHKSWNHRQKKIFPNKQVGYLRWRNILPECYQILKKKG
jgi:hypothetical protein